jgi:uncharacterized integral membrane protein (TIGR00698 family)
MFMGVVSILIAHPIPTISGLVIAIILGILWRNVAPYPAVLNPGTKTAQKPILRLGIVLLGLQIPLGVVLGLGSWVIVAIIAAVGLTFWITMVVGRWLKISRSQRLLMASGFSICGAAAVAATDSVTDSDEDEVATALGMVVAYGTLMILLMPALAGIFGLSPEQAGVWIGLSTHEVAQVIAAGGIVGGGALSIAVTVKLARVLMLAPVLAGIAWAERRRPRATEDPGTLRGGKRPPLVPLFVIGFVGCVAISSLGTIPEPVTETLQSVQMVLLATAMFALGLSVHVPSLIRIGGRPAILGAISTFSIVVLGGLAVMMPSLLGIESV